MNKSLRIILQIILICLSWGILLWSHEFPNILIGIFVISLFIVFSTYYLWSKTSKNTLIKSIVIIIVLETLKMYGGNDVGNEGIDGMNTSQIISYHFSNVSFWLLPTIMIIVLILLLFKVLFFDKNQISENEELKKK
jgi:chromate transport protein ChrA